MKLDSIFPFLVWIKTVNAASLKADLIAGLTGAIIVLPQGIAFASIAGLPPQYGLYTAIVTPIVAALFGSSRHLVSGPTTAISIVIFTTLDGQAPAGSDAYISMVLTLTFMAGVYQLAFGLARLGVLVNFVSHTVVIGFTAGAAILIITSQIKNITNIAIPKGESFLHTWLDFFQGLGQTNVYVLIIALFTLLVAIGVKRYLPKAPNLLIALIAGSVLALIFKNFTNEIQFVQKITASVPPLSLPDFSFATLQKLAPQAFVIALLGLIEAVSISRSVANKSNQRINASQEFIGQGASNIVGSFFSSFAGSGSFTRTGLNYDSGAKTPLSAIFAALILLVIVILIAPLIVYLPVAAMGGVILLVAYNLIDFKHIRQIIFLSRTELAILATTFFATLFIDLEFAIYLGVLLSLVLFLARTSTPQIVTLSYDDEPGASKRKLINIDKKPIKQCPQLKIIRIDMAVYFGSINYIQKRIAQISDNERIYHILIDSSGINFIDLAGAEALVIENRRLSENNGGLYFVGLKSSVYEFTAKTCFVKNIGNSHFFDSKTQAIRGIYYRLDKSICETCNAKIFNECP